MISTWIQEKFEDFYEPTVFDTYHVIRTYKNAEVKVQIWDTSGSDDHEQTRAIAYADTDCFLICFSLVDKISFRESYKKWLSEVKAMANDCPCILVGTKLDLKQEIEEGDDPAKIASLVTNAEIKQI